MKVLFDALYLKMTTDGSLPGEVSTRIYMSEAPEKTTYPYIVIHCISFVKEKEFTKPNNYRALVQIDIWSKPSNDSDAEIDTIQGYMDTCIDEGALTIAGYTHVGTTHDGAIGPRKEEDVWHYLTQYIIWFEKD